MLQIGQKVQAHVEKLILSGKGLIRHEGWVIFVDDVIAGEEVLVTITEKKKSYFLATLDKITTQSKNRISPKCKYFGTCGGCQLQHMDYETQLHVKKMWVAESLSKIGKVPIPESFTIKPSKKIFEYRIKSTLHFHYHNDSLVLGYFARDHKTLFNINACPIFIESTEVFEKIRTFLQELSGKPSGDVYIIKGESEQICLRFNFEGSIPINISSALHHLNFAKVWVDNKKDTNLLLMTVKELEIYYSPYVFLQANFNESLELYEDIIQHIQNLAPKTAILDLYSGIGILSLLLAKLGFKVIGIESNKEAVKCARLSLKKNNIENADFYDGMVENVIRKIAIKKHLACWILNPPRIGLSKEVISIISSLLPELCIYVSCSPATLARDILLLSENYDLYHLSSYDMFPQTTHLESVAILKKKSRSLNESDSPK